MPKYKNKPFTAINTTLNHTMFFWASRRDLQVRFFCIMSWSKPVMEIVMKIPATNCFQKKDGACGWSQKKTRPKGLDFQ